MRTAVFPSLLLLSACGSHPDACSGDLWLREAADVAAAAACTQVGGDLIVAAPDLVDFTGLEGLESITGELRIGSDAPLDLTDVAAGATVELGPVRLESMRGLSGLRSIGDGLRIEDSFTVEDYEDCKRVYDEGITVLSGARALTTLDGLDALNEIGGTVSGPSAPSGCGASADPLPALDTHALDGVHVGGLALDVPELPAVIVASGADVYINRGTTSLGGAEWPERLGRLAGTFDPSLDQTSLRTVTRVEELELDLPYGSGTSGLQGLTTAGSIRFLAAEASGSFLSGFSSLESVDEDLTLDSVFCLSDLTGLEQLTTIGGTLTLYKTGVASLDPLANLGHVGAFAASENPLLDPAEIRAFVQRLGVTCGCDAATPECRCEKNGGSSSMDCF